MPGHQQCATGWKQRTVAQMNAILVRHAEELFTQELSGTVTDHAICKGSKKGQEKEEYISARTDGIRYALQQCCIVTDRAPFLRIAVHRLWIVPPAAVERVPAAVLSRANESDGTHQFMRNECEPAIAEKQRRVQVAVAADLIIHHVFETLIESRTQENVSFQLSTSVTVVHRLTQESTRGKQAK